MKKKQAKTSRGRPPMYGEKMDTRVIVSIHSRELELIEQNTGGTVSAFIRDAIAEKLEREQLKPYESNPAFTDSLKQVKKPDKEGDE